MLLKVDGNFMQVKLTRNKNQGNAILTVMVAIGLVGLLMSGILALVDFTNKQGQIVSSKFGVEQIRRNLSTMLGNSSVWAATVTNNVSLGCLQSPPTGVCTHGSNLAFSIYSAGGALFFDPATQGFRFDGTICVLGSANCTIGINFVANIECPGAVATCVVPSSVVARGTFICFG